MPPRRPSNSDSKAQPVAEDELVQALVPDPSAGGEPLTMLSGFLGRGIAEGQWRLYTSPDLSTYVDLAEADIVHSEPLTKEQSPLGGRIVWVRRTASLPQAQASSRQLQAEFLSGDIAAGLGPSGAGFPGQQYVPGVAPTEWCTRGIACIPSVVVACQTWICGPAQGGGMELLPIPTRGCPTLGTCICTRVGCNTSWCTTHGGCTSGCPTSGCPTPGCPTVHCTPGCPIHTGVPHIC